MTRHFCHGGIAFDDVQVARYAVLLTNLGIAWKRSTNTACDLILTKRQIALCLSRDPKVPATFVQTRFAGWPIVMVPRNVASAKNNVVVADFDGHPHDTLFTRGDDFISARAAAVRAFDLKAIAAEFC